MQKNVVRLASPEKRNLDTLSFESVLRAHYSDTKRESVSEVVFDFEAGEWCETFEMSLLTLWMKDLVSQGKRVRFLPPRPDALESEKSAGHDELMRSINKRINAYSYLVQSLFIDFVRRIGACDEEKLKAYESKRTPKSVESSISPLVFFENLQGFSKTMDHVRQNHLSIFGPVQTLAVIKSGEIRDVILRELGENIFDHADGRSGHLVMTVRNRSESAGPERSIARAARISSVPTYEKGFFRLLGNSGYLTLVISDHGPGIPKTLRSSYKRDNVVPRKIFNPQETTLIDYAFLQYSSSKKPKERLGAFTRLLSQPELTNTLPATGLFYVMIVVRAYRGMLTVRSGRSIVCYDFLSYPERGHPQDSFLTNNKDRRLRSLGNLGGTQIRVFFPTSLDPIKRSYYLLPPKQEAALPTEYRYVSFRAAPSVLPGNHESQLAEWIEEHIHLFQKLKLQARVHVTAIVDCEDWQLRGDKAFKALFLLLVELMRMQDDRFCTIIVNGRAILDRLGYYLTNIAQATTGILKEKPLLGVDENLELSVHGLSDHEVALFTSLLRPESPLTVNSGTGEDDGFLEKIRHLIRFDSSTNTFHPLFSLSEICQRIRKEIRRELESHILDPNRRIFHEKGCFLIPSGAYTEGYFELQRLLKDPRAFEKVCRWVRYGLQSIRPTNLVTLGQSAGVIGEALAGVYKGLNHINVKDPRNAAQSFRLALLPKNDRTTILTDVIGTQRSIRTVLTFCANLDVCAVWTLVDTREADEGSDIKVDELNYPLEAIVRKPLKFSTEDKPTRYRYEEIIRVDPVSNAPIHDPFSEDYQEPIWKKMDRTTGQNDFLEVLASTNSIVIGHFEANERHILYLFLTAAIAKTNGAIISAKIREDIQKYRDRDPRLANLPISHIFFPEHTPAANEIAREVSLMLGNCRLVGLSPDEIRYPSSHPTLGESLQAVVVFDDASATGYSVRQMIDVAERNGAEHIFVYVLCNRSDPSTSRLLQQIQQYGLAKVHVRYLSEFPVPTFSPHECPVCRNIEALRSLREEVKGHDELSSLLEQEIYGLQKQPVARLLNPELVAPYVSTPLSDRRTQGELRSHLEIARNVVGIRKALADLVREFVNDPAKVLAFLTVVAREESYFLRDRVEFDQVFYDGFRQSIVQACKYFLQRISEISDQQLTAVLTLLRVFSPNALLEGLERAIAANLGEKTLAKIIIQCLLSSQLRTRSPDVLSVLRSQTLQSPGGVIQELQLVWEQRAAPQDRSRMFVDAFKRAYYKDLSDSGPLSNALAYGLEYQKFSTMDLPKVIEQIETFWPDASSLLKVNCLPALRLLANAKTGSSPCERLKQHIALANTLVYSADELAQVILDRVKPEQEGRAAVEGFVAAISQLHHLMLEDGEGTIPTTLSAFRSDLRRVVERVLRLRENELKQNGIDVSASWPDDACLVFGPEVEVFTILNNLLDNVIKHAFASHSDQTKACLIALERSAGAPIRVLRVADNGVGMVRDLKYGVGLSTVKEIADWICDGWEVNRSDDSPFRTEVLMRFFHLSEGRE
ncbi:MAG: sensor histidine kinase [Terriglobia bacterium]